MSAAHQLTPHAKAADNRWDEYVRSLIDAENQRETVEHFMQLTGLIPVHPALFKLGIVSGPDITAALSTPLFSGRLVSFWIDAKKQLYAMLELPQPPFVEVNGHWEQKFPDDQQEMLLNQTGLAWILAMTFFMSAGKSVYLLTAKSNAAALATIDDQTAPS